MIANRPVDKTDYQYVIVVLAGMGLLDAKAIEKQMELAGHWHFLCLKRIRHQ